MKNTQLHIGKGLLKNLTKLCSLKNYSKVFFLTDSYTEKVKNELLEPESLHTAAHIIIDPGEKAKNIETVQKIWTELLKGGADRKSVLINIGGGVITDTGGFAASTYMRGIDFIHVPTSLLAQVDASVGGKVGINFSGVKNLIGTFAQPKAVVIDIETLKTLPDREFISAFGEIIKHGLIFDRKYFEYVTSKHPREFTQEELIKILEKSCNMKLKFVAEDESESGKRKLLNFGHTIGHAIEALSLEADKPLLHGEAVSIGMVAEGYISHLLGKLTKEEFEEIKKRLQHAALPISVKNISKKDIKNKLRFDKKNKAGHILWTLLEDIGKGIFDQEVTENTVDLALEEVIGK